MNLSSKYKVLYEVVINGVRKLYVSEDAAASADDAEVNVEEYRQYKLFFEKNGKIYARKADGTDLEVVLVADGTNILTGETKEVEEETPTTPVNTDPTPTTGDNPTTTDPENTGDNNGNDDPVAGENETNQNGSEDPADGETTNENTGE